MARLCIRITPNNHPTDPSLDAVRTQIGDVVCVTEDGHIFSKGEMECGQYRIIDVPDTTPADLVHLTEPQVSFSSITLNTNEAIKAARKFTLDIAKLKTGGWKNRTAATKAQIDAITIAKA